MKAIILAVGYATRLYPSTLGKPKALLDIKGKPILDYIIEKISEVAEINEIFIVSNDKFYMNFVWWLKNYKGKKEIEILNDRTTSNETRLGGIGDLWFTVKEKNIQDDILVVLGDNLFDFDLKEIVDFFKKANKTVAGLYKIQDIEEVKKMSIVEVENGKIINFEEKPPHPESNLSSIGIYIFNKEDLGKIQEHMETDKPKDAPGFLIQDFCQKQDVYAFLFKGKWFDIGSKETYEKVNKDW